MTIEFKGALKFDLADERVRDAAVMGLEVAVEHIVEVVRRRTPNEEGSLERSIRGTVDETALTGGISADTPYAVPQHERLDYRHSDGRTAKYIEGPLQEESDTAMQIIAAQVRRALR